MMIGNDWARATDPDMAETAAMLNAAFLRQELRQVDARPIRAMKKWDRFYHQMAPTVGCLRCHLLRPMPDGLMCERCARILTFEVIQLRIRCGECFELRNDERVQAGMKCRHCAYAADSANVEGEQSEV